MPSLFASYLRVYEPLTAFDRDRQEYWRSYVRQGRAVTPQEGPVRQRTAVIEALGAGWTRLPDLPDEAYVLETGEAMLVCPWNLRVRVAEAALSAREGVPAVLADAFVPPVLAGQAKAVVEDWRSGARVLEHGVPRLHEQISTWGVPLRWFVLVDPEERELDVAAGRGVLRYRTEISKARRRSSRALSCCASRWGRCRSPRRSRRPPVAGGVPSPVGGGTGLRRPGGPAFRGDPPGGRLAGPGRGGARRVGSGRGRGGFGGVRQAGRPVAGGAAAGKVQLAPKRSMSTTDESGLRNWRITNRDHESE